MFSKQLLFFDSLEALFYSTLQQSISTYGYIIKEYVVNKQLYEAGEDGNTVRLKGYTRATIRIKIAKGQPADRTTLKDTGRFYLNITVNASLSEIIIKSNVDYDKNLIRRYGKAILIPSVENVNEFLKFHVLPDFKENVSKLAQETAK